MRIKRVHGSFGSRVLDGGDQNLLSDLHIGSGRGSEIP